MLKMKWKSVRFDKYEQMWYDYIALKGKSNFNAYTSESGIVETDYKHIVKEHPWADYQKEYPSRLVRKAIRYHVARFVRTEKEITE